MSIIPRDLFFHIFGPSNLAPDTPFSYPGQTIPRDLNVLVSLLRTINPENVIEIGIQKGSTAKVLLAHAPFIKRYIGIDITPDVKPNLPVQYAEVPTVAGELVQHDPRVQVIVKANGTRDLTAADLPAADFIFIDGDHSEQGVLYDTMLARQVIRAGGVICWHDYNNSLVPSVTKVINELNIKEGNHICQVEGTQVCFEFRRTGR